MYQLYLLWLFFLKFLDAQTDEYCVLLSCGDTPNTVCARALWVSVISIISTKQ